MKKLKWIALSLVTLLLGGSAFSWLSLRSWTEKNLTPDALVEQIERNWNCRASIKTVEAHLLSSPARVQLKKIYLTQRDAEVGKPLDSRGPLPSMLEVAVQSATLELDPWALLTRRIHVRELSISDVYVHDEISPEGTSSLQALFEKPTPDLFTRELNKLKQSQLPSPEAATKEISKNQPTAQPPSSDATPKTPASPPQISKAISLPFGIQVEAFNLTKTQFHFINRRAKTGTDIGITSLRISDADIDTDDLTHHNQCKATLDAHIESTNRVRIDGEMKEVKMAEFDLTSNGLIHPFDPSTGALAPEITLSVAVKKGSTFGGSLTFGAAFGKDKNLTSLKDKFGLDITDLSVGGALQSDLATDLRIHNGRTEFLKDATLAFPSYSIALNAGSWINGPEDMHEAHLQLLPGEELTRRISDAVSVKLGSGFAPIVMGIVKDEHGQLRFEFKSSERLSKPNFELDGKLKALENLGKQLGGGLLKGLLGP